jgi:hypothetical protein
LEDNTAFEGHSVQVSPALSVQDHWISNEQQGAIALKSELSEKDIKNIYEKEDLEDSRGYEPPQNI